MKEQRNLEISEIADLMDALSARASSSQGLARGVSIMFAVAVVAAVDLFPPPRRAWV
jgi:hypothetical protein